MNLQAMMKEVEIDNKIMEIIEKLVIVKANSIESDTINQPKELVGFLKDKLEYYYSYAKGIKNEKKEILIF